MLTELLDHLDSVWLPQLSLNKPLSAIKAAGSTGQARKINFLVFEYQATAPRFLLKLVRDQTYQNQLADEFDKLKYLYAFKPLQPTIPRPLGLFKYRENLVMVEECLPGISLENLLLRGKHHTQTDVATDLRNVQAWLIAFLHETRAGTTIFRGQIEIKERLDLLSVSLSEQAMAQMFSLADRAQGLSLPLTARHGDFWPGNMLVSESKIGIIDWETLTRSSWPFDDLFFFTVMYALRHRQGIWPEKKQSALFELAFMKNNSFSHQLCSLGRQVTQSLGITPELASFFFVLFLMDMASNQTKLGRTGENHSMWKDFLQQIHSLNELVFSK